VTHDDDAAYLRIRAALPTESTVDLEEHAARVAAVVARSRAVGGPPDDNHALYTVRLLRASANGGGRIRPVR
jgi:hypothetical protein